MSRVLFNEAAVERLKHIGDDLENCFTLHIEQMLKWKISEIDFGDPKSISELQRVKNNLEIYVQSHIYRCESLIRTTSLLVLGSHSNTLAFIARGHWECTIMLGYLADRLMALKRKNIKFNDFHLDLANALLSARHPHLEHAPNPKNIITCIEKANRFLVKIKGLEELDGAIDDCYGWLSDYCHPNFLSSKLSYSLNSPEHVFSFEVGKPNDDVDGEILNYLAMSCNLFETFAAEVIQLKSVLK